MMIRFVLLCFSLLFSASAAKLDETLATVNGEFIYLSEFEQNAQNVMRDLSKVSTEELSAQQQEELRRKVLDQMVDDLLLLQEARRLKVKVYEKDTQAGIEEIKNRFRRDEQGRAVSEREAEEAFQLELKRQGLTYEDFQKRIEKQLLVIKLVDQQIKSKLVPPSEKDTRAFFNRVKTIVDASSATSRAQASTQTVKGAETPEEREEIEKLAQLLKDRTAERVRARHILIKTSKDAGMVEKSKALAKINQIKKKLEQEGADFGELAEQYSQDIQSAKRGGDLGYFIRGWMVPAFEEAAFKAAIGKVVGPVETEFGYHLILVEEKRAATALRFSDVEEDLAGYLMQREFQKKLKEYVKDLRSKAVIKIEARLMMNERKKEGKP